ncbi:MAG TPA: universal stress protein [Streptosporangiaceae bacterium]|jgi:nucleotide-binding universal stress UspA family protein|nr:universal stress protein [Streptosporangiaceae bacterium]HJY96589.1 universal stress protein [Streptosporangiaceae bacterium]
MPGILVGIDGSAHSQPALEWAANEAVIRHTSLTVLTVHQAVAGFWGGVSHFQGDAELTAKARDAAQAETDKVLSGLQTRPESVTVMAVHGIPAEEILNAGADADMIVVGSRGGGGFARLLLGSVSATVAEHATVPVTILPA